MIAITPSAPDKDALAAQARRGVAWVFGSSGVTTVVRVGLFAVLARLLEPADFGLYAAVISVLGVLEMIALLGVGPALIQRRELTDRHIATAFSLSLLLGGLATAGIWLGAGPIATLMRIAGLEAVLKIVAPIFVIRCISMVGYGLASRDLRFGFTSRIDILSFVLGYALPTILLAWAGFGAWALILGYVIQQAFSTLLLTLAYGSRLSFRLHRRELGELVGFSSGMTLANLANYLAQHGDYYVVGRMLGVEALGLYNRAYNLMQFPVTTVVNMLDCVIFPALAKVQAETESLRRALRISVSLVVLVYLPLAAVLVVCAPDLVAVLLGSRWLGMIGTFRILCLGLVFRAGYKTASTVLKVRGRAFLFAGTQLAYAAFVFAGAALGVAHGIEGVAVGIFVALAGHCVLLNALGFHAVGQAFDFLRRDLPLAFLLSAVAGGSAWVVAEVTTQAGLPAVARLAAVALALAGGGSFAVRFSARTLLRPEILDFLQAHGQRFTQTGIGLARRLGFARPPPVRA